MEPIKFISFKTDISGIQPPEKFTFPFYYTPHKLAEIAALELQNYLENQQEFEHNFGFSEDKKNAIGKMFGVLVVKNHQNKIGFLAAFSGKLEDESCPDIFVPPVFDLRTPNSFYRKGEIEIEKISEEILKLKENKKYQKLKTEVQNLSKEIEEELTFQRKKMKIAKKERKLQKKEGQEILNAIEFKRLEERLEQESFNNQFFYKELVIYYENKVKKKKEDFLAFENKIAALKKLRKEKSAFLQKTLFEKFQFLNQKKEVKPLIEIFNNPALKPPAGSGECAAPKLLQYAFVKDLKPICLAEFWWGISPNSAIRKHKNYYPACQSRCKPILKHMLNGLEMDANLLLENASENKKLEIIFEDNVLIVVNKPSELLSVPGKEITDSVYTRIKDKYPNATGPLIVHRLDMSTSGVLVLTKTKEANKILQNQFIERSVKKRYVALLEGVLQEKKGEIDLPLRVDLDDRPKQLVCYAHGKNAKTKFEVLKIKNEQTKINFYPITGRTHQLRVHAAHKKGLNLPIVGDDLYGTKQDRLHLHAEFIEFYHPETKEKISFRIPPEF